MKETMTTKEKIANILSANKGTFFSGEELAQEAGVTRAAVWKAVKALETDGYAIEAISGRGYRMRPGGDILSKTGILRMMEHPERIELSVVPVTGSTNADVRTAAQNGAKEGYTVIAAEQTNGSGRRGRSFYSPKGTGVYISTLLRPASCRAEEAMRITTIAAVAACRAVEQLLESAENPAHGESLAEKKTESCGEALAEKKTELCGEALDEKKSELCGEALPGIKWVNDVYLRGRKICGILTQASFDMESGFLDYAVMGIGFNVYEPEGGFPDNISQIAGAIFEHEQEDAKNRLCAAFLDAFYKGMEGLRKRGYAEEYRKRSLVIGKEIRVLTGGDYEKGADAGRKAKALAIDDDCHLLVAYDDGTEEWLSSGEISIRI